MTRRAITWIFVLLRPRWHPACSASLQPCNSRLCDGRRPPRGRGLFHRWQASEECGILGPKDIRREAYRHRQESCCEERCWQNQARALEDTTLCGSQQRNVSFARGVLPPPPLPTSQSTLMQFPPFPGAHSCRGEVREGGGRAGREVAVTLGRLSSAPPETSQCGRHVSASVHTARSP